MLLVVKKINPALGTVLTIILAIPLFWVISTTPNKPVVAQGAPVVLSPEISKFFSLVNKDRTDNGLKPLVYNMNLQKSAQEKCNDMVSKNYWAHISPSGDTPWIFIQRYTNYKIAGENLGRRYTTPDQVETAWMNSPGHRANILSKNFTDVGYGGCSSEDNKIVVQHFDG